AGGARSHRAHSHIICEGRADCQEGQEGQEHEHRQGHETVPEVVGAHGFVDLALLGAARQPAA
ncbi:MAG TPA: hypothetical protein DD399_14960, partial [Alcanivorax sp.]|nr:hypothetical protein [Alcanivorax sp.]